MARHSTVDTLINLPQGILENIFSRLSIRDLVRTSVLSTNWRNKWISFPHLMFDDDCAPSLGKLFEDGIIHDKAVLEDNHNKFVKIVNHVLLIHEDPIQTFKMTNSFLQSCSEIDSWILSLSSNSLQELQLDIFLVHYPPYRVPKRLFSFKNLIRLQLSNCSIMPPPLMFNGFRLLKRLCLSNVQLSHETLQYLVSLCLELERLSLSSISHIAPRHIRLSNPKLKYLSIFGELFAIFHHDLKHVSYAIFYPAYDTNHQWKTCNILTDILRSLLCIRTLVLGHHFLQYASRINVPRKVLSTNNHLRCLSFYLEVDDMTQILVAICLLNSALNLQDLTIEIRYESKSPVSPMDLQRANRRLESTFNVLKSVTLIDFQGTEIELILVKHILANSPVLQAMRLFTITDRGTDYVLRELIRFKRASPQAEVLLQSYASYLRGLPLQFCLLPSDPYVV